MINILKENGLKVTKQRLEFLNMINILDEEATIKNIFVKLKINDDRFRIINHKVEIEGICNNCDKS